MASNDELQSRYDTLATLWNQAVEQLRANRCPRPVVTEFFRLQDGHQIVLAYRRFNAVWRLCIADRIPEDNGVSFDNWRPYEEWSGEMRIAAAHHLAELKQLAKESVDTFISDADAAIDALRKALET